MIKIFELGDEVHYHCKLLRVWQDGQLKYIKEKIKLSKGIIIGKRFMPIGKCKFNSDDVDGFLAVSYKEFNRQGTQIIYQVAFNIHRLPDLVAPEDLIAKGDLIFNGKD